MLAFSVLIAISIAHLYTHYEKVVEGGLRSLTPSQAPFRSNDIPCNVLMTLATTEIKCTESYPAQRVIHTGQRSPLYLAPIFNEVKW